MNFIFHGAAKEVGRSCIEVRTRNNRFLIDCGIKLTEHGTEYPVGVDDYDFDAVFISHAHLDHTGALPLFDARGMDCPIIATDMTKLLTRLLLKDAFKIGKLNHAHMGYDEYDIQKVMKCMRNVNTKQKGTVAGINYEYFDAGHIPGSASPVINVDGKTILYTGDINTVDTQLHRPAQSDYDSAFGPIDIMITESTYGDRSHPPRHKTEEEFIASIKAALKRGGSVIIPSFAIGRAQELILLLAQQKFGVNIYLDGMAVKATELTLKREDSVKSHAKLQAAFNTVKKVKGRHARMDIVKERAIFVTTSGMLTGGPVIEYLKHTFFDAKSAILLTGYQGDGTNGRMLLEEGAIYLDGQKKRVKCEVKQFDFSAHAGLMQLKDLIKRVRPKKLLINHGDPGAIENLAEWARALGFDTETPELNSPISI